MSKTKHEEYSDYRYIPDGQPGASGIAVSTFDKYVKIIVNTPYNVIETNLMLSVYDAAWLAEQLDNAADTIVHNALESEETEQ